MCVSFLLSSITILSFVSRSSRSPTIVWRAMHFVFVRISSSCMSSILPASVAKTNRRRCGCGPGISPLSFSLLKPFFAQLTEFLDGEKLISSRKARKGRMRSNSSKREGFLGIRKNQTLVQTQGFKVILSNYITLITRARYQKYEVGM